MKYYNTLYIAILALLCVPLLQSSFKLVKLKPLAGVVFQKNEFTPFTLHNWFDGSYAGYKEREINDSVGFGNAMVRLRNQVDFSLFGVIHPNSVAMGKEGCLYERHYIDAYYGADYKGAAYIKGMVHKLQFISDTLQKLNKTLLLVIAPSKALYYPEFLPDTNGSRRDSNNYDTYLQYLKKTKLNYIDFNEWFVLNKNKTKYPLECKKGVHWTLYGADLAGDSLISYIENVRRITLAKAVWRKMDVHTDTLSDVDLEDLMNLQFKLSSSELAYPDIVQKQVDGTSKPKVLIVGDSYYFGLRDSYHIEDVFSADSKFWYYFNTPEHTRVGKQQVQNELKRSDIVMIMCTTYNLNDLGWGFVDELYNVFHKNTSATNLPLKEME